MAPPEYNHLQPVPASIVPARPASTLLHRVMRENLETYLAGGDHASEFKANIPFHIEATYRQYLKCGILAHGFALVYCASCGHDFLVAFSCKGRDICPSCASRRMAGTAAHMIDNALPRVPYRQWVLSMPKRQPYSIRPWTLIKMITCPCSRKCATGACAGCTGMATWTIHTLDAPDHAGGWSVDASVTLPAWDRHGLDRLAKLITPPRVHKHRYCGVLAPNAKLRRAVIETAGPVGGHDGQSLGMNSEVTTNEQREAVHSCRWAG